MAAHGVQPGQLRNNFLGLQLKRRVPDALAANNGGTVTTAEKGSAVPAEQVPIGLLLYLAACVDAAVQKIELVSGRKAIAAPGLRDDIASPANKK